MRIALVVDNPIRDLAGLVLVAMRLCREDATCYFVPVNLQWWELGLLAPDIVLLNYLRVPNEELARALNRAGARFAVLDTEGGVLASLNAFARRSFGSRMEPDSEVRSALSAFCSWGPRFARHAVEEGWFKPEDIVVTGNPRFDFYASRWRDAAMEISNEADRYGRPLVLLSSKFALGNPRFLKPEDQARAVADRHSLDLEVVRERQRIQLDGIQEFTAMANHLAGRFQEVTLVVRPHPFEKMETYQRLLEPRKNLFLAKEGAVTGWILRSSAVIQNNSTTALEAGMAGVPAFSPTWVPDWLYVEAVAAASVACESQPDLDERLEAALEGGKAIDGEIAASLKRTVADWFGPIDGRAHQRVAEALLNGLNRSGRRADAGVWRRIHYELPMKGRSVSWRAAAMLKKGLDLPPTWSLRLRRDRGHPVWDSSEKQFGVADVQRIVRVIRNCRGPDSPTGWPEFEVFREPVDREGRVAYEGRTVVLRRLACGV